MPCLLSNPWELLLRYDLLLCYARRRGLGLSVIMTDVRLLINGSNLRWQLKLTSGWIEAPGEPSVACISKDRHPGSKGS